MIAIANLIFFVSTAFAQAPVDDPCKPDEPRPECKNIEAFNLGGGNLNVRSAPAANGKILGTIKDGTILKAKAGSENASWMGVEYKASQAYVSKTYARCTTKEDPPAPPTSTYAWTVPAYRSVCQNYGNKIAYQSCGFHTGLDICASQGAAIVALAAGKVVHVGPLWLDGAKQGRGPYSIVLDHGNGTYSTYGHNSKTIVAIGDDVNVGQKIGEVGSLGYSSGPHLHLEVLTNTAWTGNWRAPFANACTKYVDPLKYAAKP